MQVSTFDGAKKIEKRHLSHDLSQGAWHDCETTSLIHNAIDGLRSWIAAGKCRVIASWSKGKRDSFH